MSSLTLNFLLHRQEVPAIKELYSEIPYLVLPTNTAVTANDAENLLKSAQTSSLKDRVQKNANHYTVDQFFQVRVSKKAPRDEAVKLWSSLRSRCQVICIGSVLAAFGLTVWGLQGAPLPLLAPLFVIIIVSACFIGRGYIGFKTADHQLTAWGHPGEDFARRRKADLELPLEKISQNKCHYDGRKSNGTLLGVEILYLFTQHFKHFAVPLLDRKCDEPREQHQWVVDFLTSNPLTIDFFKDNPQLLRESGWKNIQSFQKQVTQLQGLLKNLQGDVLAEWKAQIATHEHDAQLIQRNEREGLLKGIETVVQKMSIDPATAAIYQGRLLGALDELLLNKIVALVQDLKSKSNYPFSIFYVRARYLLEQAGLGLIGNMPYALDPAAFANPQEVQNYYKSELGKITKDYPQNLIDKVKSLAPDDLAYQRFIAEVFKA